MGQPRDISVATARTVGDEVRCSKSIPPFPNAFALGREMFRGCSTLVMLKFVSYADSAVFLGFGGERRGRFKIHRPMPCRALWYACTRKALILLQSILSIFLSLFHSESHKRLFSPGSTSDVAAHLIL